VGALQIAALLGGAVLAAGIGLFDDFLQLRARWQLLGQLALACAAVALGVTVASVNFPAVPGGTLRFAGPIAAIATVLWIVGMINSINFIDGLDGLSTGIALIAAVTLGTISLGLGTTAEPFVALFCFILAGALAGFLRWNFHPASIFSGTSGIMFVGYSLAVLSVLGAGKIAVALLVLGVPIMTRSGSSSGEWPPGDRRSAPTAATFITACWTWACHTAIPSWSSTGSASSWRSCRSLSPGLARCTPSWGSSSSSDWRCS